MKLPVKYKSLKYFEDKYGVMVKPKTPYQMKQIRTRSRRSVAKIDNLPFDLSGKSCGVNIFKIKWSDCSVS
jgi:hypothetical protein